MTKMENSFGAGQEQEWEELYAHIGKILSHFGRSDYMGRADYWIVDDNWGCRQHKIYVNALQMLAPHIVELLQGTLTKFPDWEIIVSVSLEGAGKLWPKMGLIIRSHEIIDGLQRHYFPGEFQNFKYAGSRPGPVLNED